MTTRGLFIAIGIATAVIVGVLGCVETQPRPVRPTTSRPPAGWVDVEIARGPGATLAVDGPYALLEGEGRVLESGDALGPVRVRATSRDVFFGEARLGPGPLEVQPRGRAAVQVDGRAYRGVVRVEARGRTVVVNRLPVDDYLRGVLPGEMPDGFGIEALKAQAVAARTYALQAVEQGQRLYADQRSQMYGGLGGETLVSSRAVRLTEGEVLKQRGRLIPAWYHSTCGGTTVAAGRVFPQAPPGVLDRPVTCPDCRASPTYSWQRRFDAVSVCAAAGLDLGPLEQVEAGDPGPPGWVGTFTVRAGGQQASLDAATFRSRLSAGRPLSQRMLSTHLADAPRIEQDQLVLSGRGFGHGVGLCQYGASGFARRGADYEAILARYYPGADLVRAP